MKNFATSLALALPVVSHTTPTPAPQSAPRTATFDGGSNLRILASGGGNDEMPSGRLATIELRGGKLAIDARAIGSKERVYPYDVALLGDGKTAWIAGFKTEMTPSRAQRACLQLVDVATSRATSIVWLEGDSRLSAIALDASGQMWGVQVNVMPARLAKIDVRTGAWTVVGEIDGADVPGLEFKGDELWAVRHTWEDPRHDVLVRLDPTNAHVLASVRIQMADGRERRVSAFDITSSGRFVVSAVDLENQPDLASERSAVYELDPTTGATKKLVSLCQTDPFPMGLQVLER